MNRECIIHTARIIVDLLDLAINDPQRDYQETQLGERSRFARKLVVAELKERRLKSDRNLLLTVGLLEELMQL